IRDLGPRNAELLRARQEMQAKINQWHRDHQGSDFDHKAYGHFLTEIGYLRPDPESFSVSTETVDPEIATIPGPQLVVRVENARFALNAANAPSGSPYDALYGTDIIPETDGTTKGTSYNPKRGEKVMEYAGAYLDEIAPLATGSNKQATAY